MGRYDMQGKTMGRYGAWAVFARSHMYIEFEFEFLFLLLVPQIANLVFLTSTKRSTKFGYQKLSFPTYLFRIS